MAEPLRGACIGYGFISAGGHSPSYAVPSNTCREFEIVAVADICPARRVAASEAYPLARIYDSWEQLLDKEARNIDFVDIATPPYLHSEIAHAAFDYNLHVLCEKPLAASLEQAQSMAAHAARVRRVLFPCHNYRHAPVVKAVRSLLAQDVIGPVRLATLQTFRPTHARGVPEWRPNWRRERAFSGGGIAMDHGSHTFYLAFEWLRSYPTSVTAKNTTFGNFDTEDNFSCTLTFPTGIAVAQLSWTAGIRKVQYSLHGERGAITVDDDEVRVVGLPSAKSLGATFQSGGLIVEPSQWHDASHKQWFGSLLQEFREAIEAKLWVNTDTLDALMCMATIDASYASAQLGSREQLLRDPSRVITLTDRERPHRSTDVAPIDCASL